MRKAYYAALLLCIYVVTCARLHKHWRGGIYRPTVLNSSIKFVAYFDEEAPIERV